MSPAESAVESLHSALADAHQAAVDVATAAGVLVADYVVTPTDRRRSCFCSAAQAMMRRSGTGGN